MKRLIIASAVIAVLSGCSTIGGNQPKDISPTPAVTKDQTIAAAGKVESPLTIDLPNWYIKPPVATDDFIYFAGTGYSSDLAMSREKALLDSQMKLADTINGAMNAMVKQQKSDNAGSVVTDKTSITIKKIIANTVMTGYRIEDSKILSENRNYRTFILVRYPIGDANRLLKDRLQRESQSNDSDEALQRELDKEVAPVVKSKPQTIGARPTVTPVVVGGLLPIDNAEYNQRRAETLQKPNAIILQETIR
jgi:hypothetical protein